MGTLANLYKSHKFAILGVIVAIIALFGLVGCEIKGRVMTEPAAGTQPAQYQKLSETEIAQLVAEMQKRFDDRAAEIKQVMATAATLPAEQKPAVQAEVESATAKLSSEVDAFNAKIEGALAEIAQKREKANAVMGVLGGIAKIAVTGVFDPASLVGAAFSIGGTLLGLGALADSKSKSAEIKQLKAKNPLQSDTTEAS